MTGNYWFPRKRFGWGWGPPRNLQGWSVLIAWILLLTIGKRSLPGDSGIIFFIGMIALLGLIVCFKGEPPGRGNWKIRPLWMAFTTTSAAGLFLIAGLIGYTLSKHDRFVAGTSWSESVIWWQVGVGLALIPLAALLWRTGLRSLSTRS